MAVSINTCRATEAKLTAKNIKMCYMFGNLKSINNPIRIYAS